MEKSGACKGQFQGSNPSSGVVPSLTPVKGNKSTVSDGAVDDYLELVLRQRHWRTSKISRGINKVNKVSDQRGTIVVWKATPVVTNWIKEVPHGGFLMVCDHNLKSSVHYYSEENLFYSQDLSLWQYWWLWTWSCQAIIIFPTIHSCVWYWWQSSCRNSKLSRWFLLLNLCWHHSHGGEIWQKLNQLLKKWLI